MKKTISPYLLIVASSLFVLACYSSSLTVFSTPTPKPTLASIPAVPTLLITLAVSTESPTLPGTGLENENLLTTIPSGFQVAYNAKEGDFVITEMVQDGESVNEWTTMITVEIFLGEKNTTPQQYEKTLTERWFNACENSETYLVADGAENGYSFVL